MRTFSNNFRESLRGVRQLQGIVTYFSEDSFYILTTEDSNNLTTELDDILVTQKGPVEIMGNELFSINPMFNVDLLKTVCKNVQFETSKNISIGTKVNVKIGVKVGDAYEYMNYGNFIVRKNTYRADTNSYLITAYDKMMQSMIKYDDNPLEIEFPITVKDFIIAICNKFEWKYSLDKMGGDFVNQDKFIPQDLYKGQDMTYRDILDEMSQIVAGNLLFDLDDTLIIKYFNKVLRYDEKNGVSDNDLKDINVVFGEKYGPVNSLLVTTEGNVTLDNIKDQTSIDENGETKFNINNNHFLNTYGDEFKTITDIFNQIKGIEYYLFDFDTTGLLIYEPLDSFMVRHNDIDYNCLMLNDDIKLTTGIVETSYGEKPEENVDEYTSVTPQDKKINNALIKVDKANAEIQLKVNKGDVVSEINLSPEVVELKGNRVVIDSTYFKVDETGKIIATSCEIGGFNTNDKSFSKNVSGIYDYNLFDTNLIASYIMDELPLDNNLENILDADNNGVVNPVDYAKIKDIIDGKTTNTKNVEGSFEINSTNPKNCISIKDKNNNIVSSLGMGGINTTYLTCNNIICGYPSNSFNDFIRATINGETGKITCVSLEQTSLKENKKNFEKYENALQELKKIDIYKYNLKNESDNEKKHLGFVIGDDFKYSDLITSQDNKGVDNYSFTSLCLQAIKEQQVQIENLQNQINELKEMIKNGKYKNK